MRLFRTMLPAADGLPVVGSRKFMLGVRVPADIRPDEHGRVHPGTGGMSAVANEPRLLPPYLLPRGDRYLGQSRAPVVVYGIVSAAITAPLVARADAPPHHSIEPGAPMLLDDFAACLAETRPSWEADR